MAFVLSELTISSCVLTCLQSKDFFESPVETKETCSISSDKSGMNRGWLSMHTETLDPGHQKVRSLD